MKMRDVVNEIKLWWDGIPGWHERIIWFSAGAASVAILVLVV